MTLSGAIVGTPNCMAPELEQGRSAGATTAADVFGLGAVMYHVLTGSVPFQAETLLETLRQVVEAEPERPAQVRAGVDPDLETICLKCLEKDPAKRYGSAEAMAEELERWLRYEPIQARPSTLWERGRKWVKRRPAVAAMWGVVIAVTLVGITGGFLQWQRAEDALARSELHRYFQSVNSAHHEFDEGNSGVADQLLDQCPPGLRQWEWHYLKRRSLGYHLAMQADGTLLAMAFSADGRRLAVTSDHLLLPWLGDLNRASSQLQVWDLETGQELFVSRNTAGLLKVDGFRGVHLSPDGRRIAALSHPHRPSGGMGSTNHSIAPSLGMRGF